MYDFRKRAGQVSPRMVLGVLVAVLLVSLGIAQVGLPMVHGKLQLPISRQGVHLPRLPFWPGTRIPTATAVPTPTSTPTPLPAAVRLATAAARRMGAATPASGATPNSSADVVAIPINSINIRGGPSVGYPVVGTAGPSARLMVVGRNQTGDWFQIAYDGAAGGRAWVSATVVVVQGAVGRLPVPGGAVIGFDGSPSSQPNGSGR